MDQLFACWKMSGLICVQNLFAKVLMSLAGKEGNCSLPRKDNVSWLDSVHTLGGGGGGGGGGGFSFFLHT